MSDDDLPALFYHTGDVTAGFSGGLELVSDSLMFLIFNQRIAADGDNCSFSSSHNPQLEDNDILKPLCPIKMKTCIVSSSHVT
jgi:hypothetical protein